MHYDKFPIIRNIEVVPAILLFRTETIPKLQTSRLYLNISTDLKN
jgi:hypothetical protein